MPQRLDPLALTVALTAPPRASPARRASPLLGPRLPKVRCVAENTGELGARKGVNLPGSVVDLPAMAPKDLKDLAYGLGHDMDYIAASFVRSAEGVREIRAVRRSRALEPWTSGRSARRPRVLIVSSSLGRRSTRRRWWRRSSGRSTRSR